MEPPWTYDVVGGDIHLKVMDETSVRDVMTGEVK